MKMIQGKSRGLSEDEIFAALARDVAEEIGADMVSMWAFDDKKTSITRVYCCDGRKSDSRKPVELKRSDHQRYFGTILENIYLIANDALNHADTTSMRDSYLSPLGIKSLLDYVIYRDREPVGLICCEAMVEKNWSMDDIAKVRAITVATSFEFEDQIFPIVKHGGCPDH